MVTFRGDGRGVSEVLGSILVFGLVLTLIAVIQLNAVPAANERVELKHTETVEEDLGRLQGALSRTAITGGGESVRVDLGLRYPSRFILINPPPVQGRLETGSDHPLELANLRAVNEETADYLDASSGALTFQTQDITYTPNYNQLDSAGQTVFETGVRYKRFEDGSSVQERGVLINGRQITLVTIDGELSASQVGAATLSTTALSTSHESVGVTPQGGDPVVRIHTGLSRDKWRNTVLGSEFDDPSTPDQPGKYVKKIECTTSADPDEPCDGLMEITLEQGATYNLRMAKVGIGSGFTEPQETYITDVQGDEETVAENASRKLVVEVRDQFNNPVSGVEVRARITQPADPTATRETVTPIRATTDSDGRVAIHYKAPENVDGNQRAKVRLSFGSGQIQSREKAVFDLTVTDNDGSGADLVQQLCNDGFTLACTGGGGGGITFSSAQTGGPSGEPQDYGLEFDITNQESSQITITDIEVDYTSGLPETLYETRTGGPWSNEVRIATPGGSQDGIADPGDATGGSGYDVTSTDGDPPQRITFSTAGQNAVLGSSDSATVRLYAFRDVTGTETRPTGTVEITITYDTPGVSDKKASTTYNIP